MANPIKQKEVAFNGRLRTWEDPASIGPNDFATLTNLRYTYTHPKSVNGMSVITSTGVPQNIGNAVHFRKGQPAESHVIVHAVSALYDMTAAISGAGVFSTAVWTDTVAGGTARFAQVGGLLAYANGVGDTCVYGGDEFRCGGFINYTSAAKYDFTEAVNNTKTDAGNIATLDTYQASADDNTKLLLHFENNANDSGPGGHNFNAVGVTYPASAGAWGGAFVSAAYFDGTAYMSAADHADFNLSGTPWTFDFKLSNIRHPTATDSNYVYLQQSATSADRMELYTKWEGAFKNLWFNVVSAGTGILSLSGYTGDWSYYPGPEGPQTKKHFALSRDTSTSPPTYRIFADGVLLNSTATTAEPGNYTSSVHIGSDASFGNKYKGYIDEFRISNVARWTSDFTPPSTPYGNNYASNIYIGSLMPLSGIKLYVANSQSGKTVSIAVNEWNGSGWSALTVSPMSQALADSTAYSITWASTASTSKVREVEKVVQYWYQVVLYNATDFDGVTISRCTTKIPFQQIRDFWDGKPWTLAAFLTNKSSSFQDNTANVSNDTYDSANAGSYAQLVSLATSDYMVVGSTERLLGFYLQLVGDYVNKTATTISVAYYNGTDSPDNTGAWSTVAGLVDGTLNGTFTLNKSGFVTWTPPTEGSEFKSATWPSKNTSDNTYPLYYYKITFTGATTSADVRVAYAYGIPTQRTIRGFKFVVVHQDRLWLCGDTQKDKNYVICSAYQSPTVLGFGDDVAEFWLGDDTEVVAGTSLFTRYGSTIADVLVLCKQHETYVIDGDNPTNYKLRRVSEHIGCIAPLTMAVVPMGDEAIPGTPRNIAIWLSQQGVVAFDGTNFVVISKDIHDRFDPTHANYISGIGSCTGYYDSTYGEYHLIVPDSAEYVYDVAIKKWFTMDRGTFDLRCGVTVYDTNGLAYTYGAADTKLYRLENGSTMAGDAYTRTLRTGDMALPEGSITDYARVNWLMLVGKTMTNPVSASYYTDSSSTAGAVTTLVSTNAGKRLMNKVGHKQSTQATLHGFELAAADSFEPFYLAFRYTVFPRELT